MFQTVLIRHLQGGKFDVHATHVSASCVHSIERVTLNRHLQGTVGRFVYTPSASLAEHVFVLGVGGAVTHMLVVGCGTVVVLELVPEKNLWEILHSLDLGNGLVLCSTRTDTEPKLQTFTMDDALVVIATRVFQHATDTGHAATAC